MTASAYTRAQLGMEAPLVTVEVYCGNGLPQFTLVGLAEAAVRESRERVQAALINSGYSVPAGRIVVNLSPADLPKEGGRYDLAIAMGLLAASGQIPAEWLQQVELYGELSLAGALRPVPGLLVATVRAAGEGRSVVVPKANEGEARLATSARVLAVPDLTALVAALRDGGTGYFSASRPVTPHRCAQAPELAEVRGQSAARRALEIAAAGGHALLMVGPPGAGKSMLATRMTGLLPPLSAEEATECAMVRSLTGRDLDNASWHCRPFRAPHHAASASAIVGGGSRPMPGEVSLAHHGVLFLDELPEFNRAVLEALREPLECGSVRVVRAGYRANFPARFQLVAAMNPCPCGFAGYRADRCRCSPSQVHRYAGRVSGPLVDRIDLHVFMQPSTGRSSPADSSPSESTATVAARVEAAREVQSRRGALNARLEGESLEGACAVEPALALWLEDATHRLGLSARAQVKVRQVARTVADLAGRARMEQADLAEALSYRRLDRSPAGG
ncbi:MAG: YifB family Mg chelatase-like AAA ATPase [Steroidobacteraceae bacterium]